MRIGEDDRAAASESAPISKELATAINDGLFFYEQVDRPIVYFSGQLVKSVSVGGVMFYLCSCCFLQYAFSHRSLIILG